MQCCACVARALLCAVRLTVRAVRAAGAQAAACGWLLASGAAAGAPALLARVTAGPSNTAAPTAISRCRLARSGFRADMVLVSPRFPATFSRLSGPSQPPPPPAPCCFLVFFFRPKNTYFFVFFEALYCFYHLGSDGVCGTCHTAIYYSRAAWCATAAAASLAINTVHLVQRKCIIYDIFIYRRAYIIYIYYILIIIIAGRLSL